MKNIITILLIIISRFTFAQTSSTEYKLDQYKKRDKKEKYSKIQMGDSARLGQIYAYQSSEYWGWDYGQLVDINNNKYLLETYPVRGFKKIVKLRFNSLYNVDTNQKNLNKTVNLKMNDYLDKAGSNVQVGSLLLGALVANIIFYPKIFKIESKDDLILYNVLNGGLALGTVISFSSAGMNLKLAAKTK
jgi:hypothetical protein